MSDDVTNWLEELGLGEYASVFEKNNVDIEVLPELTDADLKELGVTLGHRKRVLKAIRALTAVELDPLVSPATPLAVVTTAVTTGSDARLAAWERMPGERKPVTMLFADITGSTALTEKLDAEETHDLLYGATQRMCAAVENNRGTVCRLMGDGVMSMFGAPVASEHHAIDACKAALEMQHAIRDYASDIEGLQIRVGLHSGEVVVLTVGEGDKVEYDASGPTVPVAARMEQVAQPGDVYLTAATQSLAAHRIETEALGPVSVKGVSEPVPVFALRRVRSVEEARRDSARTPFVGRRADLIQFRGMLEACIEEGHGQTAYIRGEPGIGKTRLVEEFARIAAEKGVSTHRGLVLPFGVGKGQDAVRSLVRSLMGIAPGGGKDERQRAADRAINGGRLEPDQAVFLNDLLDLSQPTEMRALYDAMDNATRNAGKQAAVLTLVAATSRSRPVLAIVEDVHWADIQTLARLAALTKTVSECPGLLVMTSRSEGDQLDPSWRATINGSPFFTIDLGPLRKPEAIALISDFIDSADPLAQSCLERAAGNPLFLEQLLRAAQEGSAASLPDSIQSLVLARMDRLKPEDKAALQAASVMGQRFDANTLTYLLESGEYDCRKLIEHNLVRPEGDGYLFSHALIQEGVYGSLVKSVRTSLHRRAAQWYDEIDAILHAQHLARARDPGAPGAYLRAARQEMSLYRYDRARQLVEEGLGLATDNDRFELTCLRGELLHDMALMEESLVSYQSALSIAKNDTERCRAWIGVAAGLRMLNEPSKALEFLDRAESVAQGLGSTLQLAQIHHIRGNLHWRLENHEDCRRNHELALEFAEKARSIEYQALAYGGLGDAYFSAGRVKTAYAHFKRCIDICRENGLGRIEVAHRSMVGDVLQYLGDVKGCLDECLAGAEMAARVGHVRAEILARQSACTSAAMMGEHKKARAQLERAKALTSKHGLNQQEKYNATYEGNVLACEGRREEALEMLRKTASSPYDLAPVIALIDDPVELKETIMRGEAMLRARETCYDCFQFYPAAIDGSLRLAEWEEAERYIAALCDYTRDEPLPWTDFFIARGRALAAFGRGKRDDATIQELTRLHAEAERMGLKDAIPALESVLSSV